MSKDFANRKTRPRRSAAAAGSGGAARKPQASRPPRRSGQRRGFHGPSFSGGVVLGAAVVLLGSYLPEIFEETAQKTLAVKSREAREPVQFEFDQRLRESQVRADPQTYAQDANPAGAAAMEYLIQAASFQARDDAESLRAQLILIDLPVHTNAVQLGDKPWYRVTVGPFLSQVEAGRALTRLREMNLDAFLIRRER